VPACGVFCGTCPLFLRDRKPCLGAEKNLKRCESCKTFHQCCEQKGISHCYECNIFPCYNFKKFSRSWQKNGQNFIENQQLLKRVGEIEFLEIFNTKIVEE